VVRTCLFLFLFSFSIFPYSFTGDFSAGIYWGSFPIATVISDSDSQILDQLETLTAQAVAQWEDAVGKEVWSLSSTSSGGLSGGNSIRWSNNFAQETGYNPSTTLAVTIRYRTGTFFTRYEIILNGENTALRMNSNNMLFQTILHELGHVIGLDHSSDTSAVMYASLQGINNLSHDDHSGANAAIDENIYRQSVGFVSELASSENSTSRSPLACGTIGMIDSGPGDGPQSGLISLVFGLLIALTFSFARKNLPPLSFI